VRRILAALDALRDRQALVRELSFAKFGGLNLSKSHKSQCSELAHNQVPLFYA